MTQVNQFGRDSNPFIKNHTTKQTVLTNSLQDPTSFNQSVKIFNSADYESTSAGQIHE